MNGLRKMKKADMHMHSTVSDGSCRIEALIDMAKAKGLDAIVITDHDTLSHRNQIPAYPAIPVACGVELSACDPKTGMRAHILGYRIEKPEIVEQAALPVLEARHANSLRQIEILRKEGYPINLSEIRKADGKYIYKQHIMDYLFHIGAVTELFGEFYYKTFKNGGICDFDISYLDARTAVDVIRQAGGLPVLAHSGQQQNFCLVPELVEHGLAGLELNHHANSEKDRKIIQELADRYGLFLTGGSDFHGIYEPKICSVGSYLAEESGWDAVFG
ncbi:MAG: PHP domain-containing protein [Lachnospiraceae bacterium]|nr:PHP domain-containing protein [Lachnospiraceae bacterium]